MGKKTLESLQTEYFLILQKPNLFDFIQTLYNALFLLVRHWPFLLVLHWPFLLVLHWPFLIFICEVANPTMLNLVDKTFYRLSFVLTHQILLHFFYKIHIITFICWWQYNVSWPLQSRTTKRFPFLIPTTPRCREGRYSFTWIAPPYPWYVPYNAEC